MTRQKNEYIMSVSV